MKKKEIRKFFLSERKKISEESNMSLTKDILNLLISNFDLNKKTICCYLPIKSKNEVDTFQLLNVASTLDFHFSATRWDIFSNQLTIHIVTNQLDVELNSFDIPEPKKTLKELSAKDIDFVIVPLLAFDVKGNRVGYGKGVYDLFLKKFDVSKTKFIGLSFFDPINEIDDLHSTDVKLTHCVTPKLIYTFEK